MQITLLMQGLNFVKIKHGGSFPPAQFPKMVDCATLDSPEIVRARREQLEEDGCIISVGFT